jgi:hypothetical protein
MNDSHLSDRAGRHKAWRAAFILALLCLLAFPARAATLYLSPTGSDTAAGTSPDQALATLPAAWDKARAVTPGEAVTIVVLPGTYRAHGWRDRWHGGLRIGLGRPCGCGGTRWRGSWCPAR